eukprot:Selendium_serpulae@DN5636_c0_g1_i1.p3
MMQYAIILLMVLGPVKIWQSDMVRMLRGGNTGTAGPIPQYVMWLEENKMSAIAIVFFGVNMLMNAFKSSNAFEIYVKGDLVYSALHQGALPSGRIILDMLTTAGIEVAEPQARM